MPAQQTLGRPSPLPQQLPAQMFTTAAQLLDLTDSTDPVPLPWRLRPQGALAAVVQRR